MRRMSRSNWSGGTVKSSATRASRPARSVINHLFGATPIIIDELKGHVTQSCLTALTQQLVQDTAFYSASSAPITEPGIRMVSVKARSSESSSSRPNVIPVSVPAEP